MVSHHILQLNCEISYTKLQFNSTFSTFSFIIEVSTAKLAHFINPQKSLKNKKVLMNKKVFNAEDWSIFNL